MGLKCIRGQQSNEVEELEKRKNNKLTPLKMQNGMEGSVIQLDGDDDSMRQASMGLMESTTSLVGPMAMDANEGQ